MMHTEITQQKVTPWKSLGEMI